MKIEEYKVKRDVRVKELCKTKTISDIKNIYGIEVDLINKICGKNKRKKV